MRSYMREIVLGTAGHVDHGKTSLVRALTGIDTDRLKEEKKRGITIELGFAYLDLPCGHRLGIIDVPGHEKFVKNMVAGASSIDLVAFVIAADEGVMPQTREHFEICSVLGVEKGLIVITKKDMVDSEWLELVEDDVRDYFAGSFLDEAPMIEVSSVTGEGIDELRIAIDRLVSQCTFNEAHGPFRLAVDRVFSMKGFGSVVTGTSLSGRIKVGDDIVLFPGKLEGKIRGIQVHGQTVDEVEAGNRTAINIQGLEKEMIHRGDMLASPACLSPAYVYDADFSYLSSAEKPLKNRSRVRVHLGTAEIMGRIVLLDHEELSPGSSANIQLLLEKKFGVWPGDRFVIRSYSPMATIGGGVIFNGSSVKRKRFKQVNREDFSLFHRGDSVELILYHLRTSGYHGLTLAELAIKIGLFGNRLKKILNAPVSARKILVIDSEKQLMVEESIYAEIIEQVLTILDRFHRDNPLKAGLSKEELRSRLYGGVSQKFFQSVLASLIRKKEIVQEGAEVRLAGHEVALQADEKEIRRDLENLFREAGLKPPTIKQVFARFPDVPQSLVRQVLDLLIQDGQVVKVSEDLYFFAAILGGLQEKMITFLEKEGEIDAPLFKEMTGLTRKFSIPLLEYFDRIKMTIRVGDKRILRERRKQGLE